MTVDLYLVLYKCIAKTLVARLKLALDSVTGPPQMAFLRNRSISDAILLSQEILYNYYTNQGPAKVALKINLRKAFDTIHWDYIIAGLIAIGVQHPCDAGSKSASPLRTS